jgi:hypothetical protein
MLLVLRSTVKSTQVAGVLGDRNRFEAVHESQIPNRLLQSWLLSCRMVCCDAYWNRAPSRHLKKEDVKPSTKFPNSKRI